MNRYAASPVCSRSSSIASWARRPQVVESIPPLMPSTRVLSPALRRQSWMKRLRVSISARMAAWSAKGGTTLRSAAMVACRLSILGSLTRLSDAEDMSEVGHEIVVVALGLAWGVGNLRHRLTVAGGHFNHDAHRLDTGNIAGQVGADAETEVDPFMQGPVERQGVRQGQAVGEHQGLAHGVDAELLIVGDGFLRPDQRVAGVVAQAVEQLGEVQVEVAQEGIHGDAVGQGDPQQATVLAHPAVQRRALAVDQPRAQLLVGHQPFVGHGADGLEVVFAGQVYVAGADETPGKIALEIGRASR